MLGPSDRYYTPDDPPPPRAFEAEVEATLKVTLRRDKNGGVHVFLSGANSKLDVSGEVSNAEYDYLCELLDEADEREREDGRDW